MISRQARAEGGTTDVTTASPNVLSMAMSGSVAANAFLCHTSSATETFHLEQEFEVECSDSAAESVRLSLESSLVGFVRSKHKAGAGVKMASAKVCLPGAPETPLIVVHPPLRVEGDNGRLCNQHLPLVRVDKMPLGKYVLFADFVIDCNAGGICDGHSAADFSPSTSLPSDWVRTRDPFQGVDKKDFGFKLVLTVDPPDKEKASETDRQAKRRRSSPRPRPRIKPRRRPNSSPAKPKAVLDWAGPPQRGPLKVALRAARRDNPASAERLGELRLQVDLTAAYNVLDWPGERPTFGERRGTWTPPKSRSLCLNSIAIGRSVGSYFPS